MKNMQKLFLLFSLVACSFSGALAADVVINAPYNPATGIWIQQVGDLYPSASTSATLYYTRYASVKDRVKSVQYYYDGNGYLNLHNKDTLCYTNGADGIIHHPDGDLLVAGQGTNIYKVSKTVGYSPNNQNCVVRSVTSNPSTGNYHLMMDPSNDILWAAGIPGTLARHSTATNTSTHNLANGVQVALTGSVNRITTLVWDEDGTAFYTHSDYWGGGYGTASNSSFGWISDTTYNAAGEITGLKTQTIFSNLVGAHGASYDEYSKTIFIFGDSRIVQIDPASRTIVATLDLRTYMFADTAIDWPTEVLWRLDQGTTDGKGHLFVASNSGHMIFVDYTSNPNKRIDNNILIHMQWLDNYLDDVAPLSGAGSQRSTANTSGGTDVSSSSRHLSSSSVDIYVESSSSKTGTSSGSTGTSSGSIITSSGSTGTSSGSTITSSGSTGTSSGSTITSSGSTGTSSGSIITSSGSTGTSSGSTITSSGSTGTSSGSTITSSGSTGTSSGSIITSSGSTTGSSSSITGGGDDNPTSSSSSSTTGGEGEIPDWVNSSNSYTGFDDIDTDPGTGTDPYPSNESRDNGDTLVTGGTVLTPTDLEPGTAGTITLGGNTYLVQNPVGSALPTYASDSLLTEGREAVHVGEVVKITLSADKLVDYFGANVGDTIYVTGSSGLLFVDPSNPRAASDSIAIVVTGKDLNIWVTANQEVVGGNIYFTDADGHLVIFNGINFVDPIPDAKTAFIKDSDGDDALDAVEVVLADTLPAGISVTAMSLIINGDTIEVNSVPTVKNGDRILADVSDLTLPSDFPDDATVLVTYTDKNGVNFVREVALIEAGGHVIKSAYAIRDAFGSDSLFIEFNIDLMPVDITQAEFIVFLNGMGFDLEQIESIQMPTKNLIILVGKDLGLKGKDQDYVSLCPGVTFENLPYMTSDEYDRQVTVKVTDRLPGVKYVEYYDNDGDGVLDSIVAVFEDGISEAEKAQLYFSFPWYSSRGLLIELQAQPGDLVIDPKDSTRVSWSVKSNVNLASGLTSISSTVPAANLYVYYEVMGNTFVSEQSVAIKDKMAPVIVGAALHYGDDDDADTVVVTFSEPVNYIELQGKDFFSYIHGKDTIDLYPSQIRWSADGLSASLILRDDLDGIIPGDSLMIVHGEKTSIKDALGNISSDTPAPVVISGILSHLVQSVNMGTFDPTNEELREVNSISLSYVQNTMRTADMRENGNLGHLISLGERFVPQLVDGANVNADGEYDPSVLDALDPSKVLITFSVSYYDNLGQYVNDTTLTVACDSPKFGGNCLNTDKKVFVNWNYKDHAGRFVGTGVYIVQFKLVVRYESKKIEEEMLDKWGVRRKVNK